MDNYPIRSAVVNGALGAVGLAMVKVLLEKGCRVWAVCYPGDWRIRRIPAGAEIVELDMREIGKLPEMIGGKADAFFHLAWMGTIGPGRDDAKMQSENIRCAIEAAETAGRMGCEVFTGVGSQAEYGRIEGLVTAEAPCSPVTGYGIAKLCAGQLTRLTCRQQGVRHEWARILSVYGPGDGPLSVIPTILDKLSRGEKPALTPGEQEWDFCYSEDAGEALARMAAWGRDGRIYPVGSGKTRKLREYFEIARDEMAPGMPLGIGELPYPAGQVMHLQADLTPLREDTGFKPRFSFEEGIRETVRYFRAERDAKA